MAEPDRFDHIAGLYDALMAHVEYDRWFAIMRELETLLPPGFTYLDAACGSGSLLKRARDAGWRAFGFDLSPAMLRRAQSRTNVPVFVGNLETSPVAGVDFITCLFDSMNFLISPEAVCRALGTLSAALRPDGLLYFDMVTERLMADVFGNQSWIEPVGDIMLTWESRWFPESGTCMTRLVRDESVLFECLEKAYSTEEIVRYAQLAGLEPLAIVDARNWGPVREDTTRIDFLFTPTASRLNPKSVRKIIEKIRYNLS